MSSNGSDAGSVPSTALTGRDRAAELILGHDEPPTFRGVSRVLLLLALFICGVAVQMLRIPRPDWNVLWAEDGVVFLEGALESGWAALWEPYSGYLHVVPRLLAQIATIAPLSDAPLAITLLAAAVASVLGCAVFVLMESHIRAVPLRIAAWVCGIALPIMGGEVLGSIANLHWFLLIAGFCSAVTPARTTFLAWVEAAILCAAVLSDPLAILLAPFVFARWWLLRGRRDVGTAISFAVATVLQGVGTFFGTVVSGDRTTSQTQPSPLEYLEFFGFRAAATGMLGVSGTLRAAQPLGGSLPWIALGAATLIAAAGILLSRSHRAGIIVFISSSLAFGAIVWTLQWQFIASDGPARLNMGDRYAVVPTALLMLGLLIASDAVITRIRRSGVRLLVGLVVLALVAVPAVADARVWTFRADTPSWTAQLSEGERECLAGTRTIVAARIAPASVPLWVELPCDLVVDAEATAPR